MSADRETCPDDGRPDHCDVGDLVRLTSDGRVHIVRSVEHLDGRTLCGIAFNPEGSQVLGSWRGQLRHEVMTCRRCPA